MSNLIEYAKSELEFAKLFSEEGDFYGGMTGKAVLELVECFAKQGHSGMSAGLVVDLFSKVARWNPIEPIKCTDEEWSEVGEGTFQNKRCSSVFKEGIEGKPYFLDAIVWRESNGSAFTGTVGVITSRQFIKLPFLPKTFYIDIDENRNIIDNKQLIPVFEYYEPIVTPFS